MAVVWLNSTATSSTSFNTISIWSTWDDDNNQEIPLGRLPQSGDYIYANGYTCLVPTGTLNLGNAILSNGLNEKTGRSGGTFYFVNAGTYNITANVEHFGYSVVLGSTSQVLSHSRQLTLQGNVISFTTNGTFAIKAGGSPGRTIINGNLDGEYCLESGWGGSAIIINGNVNSAGALSFYGSGGGTNQFFVTINGNCRDNFVVANGQQSSQFSSIDISGNYTNTLNANPFNRSVVTLNVKNIINTGVELNVTTLNISGYIYYRGYNNKVGVRYTTLNILNPDTFTWKDVTEPRSNPFIILTNADMNNRQQYPAESDVKLGTDYAFDNLHGKLSPDYPQQAEVLDDVEYARYEVATNNLALYNSTLYLYNGSLWSTIPYLGETTTNVTDSTHSVDPDIDINGVTTTATDGDIVKYGAYYYMWDDANTIWVKTDYYYIGETTTDISGGSTRSQLFIVGESMKGTMIPVNIPQTTLDRLANCVTVDILDAQLNAKL